MKYIHTASLAIFFLLPCALSGPAALAQTPADAQAAQETPATRPTPAQNIGAATVDSPEIRELQKVEDKWNAALNARDQYGLELVLSPLFVGVSSSGDVTTRNQQVVSLINQEDKTAITDSRVIAVRMLGDVAVANGTYTYTHKVAGNVVQEKGVFTHVFERQRGNWVCMNSQRTLLREEAPTNRSKTKTKAKSQAELPFHIPLFSKDDKTN
jgi:hypothetical protein